MCYCTSITQLFLYLKISLNAELELYSVFESLVRPCLGSKTKEQCVVPE